MSEKQPVRHVGLITKYGSDAVKEVAADIKKWCEGRDISVWQSDSVMVDADPVTLSALDLALVLGGDGTIISVARRLLDQAVPVAGINFGRVGFLAELTPETWEQALDKVIASGLNIERRMCLHYSLLRGGKTVSQGDVINDVVITRGKTARLVRLDLALDGDQLMQLRSDGLIVSTPTGSTGYACSAGGSLLMPALDAYIVASICPFLNVFSPLVLAGSSVFEVTLPDPGLDLYLTLDGQETVPLETGDILRVEGRSNRFLFADMGSESYADRLRRAGFISSLGSQD